LVGAALSRYPTSNASVESPVRWWFGCELGYAREVVREKSFGGFGAGAGFGIVRRYTWYFAWAPIRLIFGLEMGRSPGSPDSARASSSLWSLGLGSDAQFRYPFFVGPSGQRTLSFLELALGPVALQNWFSDDYTNIRERGISAGIRSTLRWGISWPHDGFSRALSLGLRYTGYFNSRPLNSDFAFVLETLL